MQIEEGPWACMLACLAQITNLFLAHFLVLRTRKMALTVRDALFIRSPLLTFLLYLFLPQTLA